MKSFTLHKKPYTYIILLLLSAISYFLIQEFYPNPVRIGYFHGGRTMLLYRSYINNEFEKEGTPVKLLTKDLNQQDYYVLSQNYEDIKTKTQIGKARGGELIDEVINGNTDGTTPGESSFIKAVSQGAPIVAVAMLGHDTKDAPGHAIIFGKNVSIKSPLDIKGKVLSSRRAGDGDRVLLEEFLNKEGVDPRDVTIIDQVPDDEINEGIISGRFDGGYYHLMSVEKLVSKNHAYVYRKLDWVNPELSQALLVFKKDFVQKHPDQVKNIIRAYMKRIKYEHSLPEEERLKDPGENYLYGLQMAKAFQGMNLPQYDFPPLVREDLLNELQDLLIKHGALDRKVDLSGFIDNRFVEEVYKELKL